MLCPQCGHEALTDLDLVTRFLGPRAALEGYILCHPPMRWQIKKDICEHFGLQRFAQLPDSMVSPALDLARRLVHERFALSVIERASAKLCKRLPRDVQDRLTRAVHAKTPDVPWMTLSETEALARLAETLSGVDPWEYVFGSTLGPAVGKVAQEMAQKE